MKNFTTFCAIVILNFAYGQKTAYIPQFLLDTSTVEGAQFSSDKTAQSDNFVLIWGNTVGADPSNYAGPEPNLAFNPTTILSTLESIYTAYKNLGFADDAPGTNLHLYKIPIFMYATWGDNGIQGYANGGEVDGVVGAFWVHPIAMQTGDVAAHELTHSLQAQAVIDYRNQHGLGAVWDNAGIFWETHANFMRNLIYPQDVTAWGMDVYHVETLGDWKNTYENYEFLMAMMESEGVAMVNKLWRQSLSAEYPLQAYKRIAGYGQQTFNDKMYEYARRMATEDFQYNNIGGFLRQYRANDLVNYLPSVQATYTILRQIPGSPARFEIPIEIAPEEYAYNVIPLYPDESSCSVIIKFKGHTELNSHSGWRYGFVAAHSDGTISRYSQTFSDDTSEIVFALESNETKMYLVVMGAPSDSIQTNPSNDTWHGYPKHFRYPYELTIAGAKPEGFQAPAQFRPQLKINGHIHSNGGGWVQNSASVANTVYVSPAAIVLGTAQLSGGVRVENTALIKDAIMSDGVHVINNAFVNGGTYSGNAIICGQGFAENATITDQAKIDMRAKVTNYHLGGGIEVGGDVVVYNETGACDDGVYYRLTNYYEDNLLECDGRTATHPANLDVNFAYAPFTDAQMALVCTCETLPGCLTLNIASQNAVTADLSLYPNPAAAVITFNLDGSPDVIGKVILYNILGVAAMSVKGNGTKTVSVDISSLPSGIYLAKIVVGESVMIRQVIKR